MSLLFDPEAAERVRRMVAAYTAHLQSILEDAGNDLSSNEEAALRYFIDIASRPSFGETIRLDALWQQLVRERDEAKKEAQRLREENAGIQVELADHRGALKARVAGCDAMREEMKQARDFLAKVFVRHAPQCGAAEGLLAVCSQIDDMASFMESCGNGREARALKDFRMREPLVHKLWFEALDQRLCECDECLERPDRLTVAHAAVAVRDFKATP